MIDINFYMKAFDLKKRLMSGEKMKKEALFEKMESFRSKEPFVYNIETTNACNMTCEMCPRTTMMTRRIENLDMQTFLSVAEQLRPYSKDEWRDWKGFVKDRYHIDKNDMSENHFFLYIIPKVIVLHGYGDPLLDKSMPMRIKALSRKGIPSYFSCNPANINIDDTVKMFESGLDYIKYSIEAVDDLQHKKIRGEASNFSESYKKIVELLDIKKKKGCKTTIVITMLDLNKPDQGGEFLRLKKTFEGMDIYAYLKSQDQKWYQKKIQATKSIHWTEFCQFPWSSMTIKSNGEAVECVEDFNNEIILGDTRKESLGEIWNGERYRKFRQDHFDHTPGIKCTEKCDMGLISDYIK